MNRLLPQMTPPPPDLASLQSAFEQTRRQALADAAVLYSGHLDRLATHADMAQLSGLEIIDLLRQESEKFNHAGFDAPAHLA